jgi:hypothetical protein
MPTDNGLSAAEMRTTTTATRCSWSEAAFFAMSDALVVALGIAGPTLIFIDFAGEFSAIRNVLLVLNVAICSALFAVLRTVRLRRASPMFLRSAAWQRSRLALLLAVALLTSILCAARMAMRGAAAGSATAGLLVTSAAVVAFASWRLRQTAANRRQ